MAHVLFVGLGGAVGSMLRYVIGVFVQRHAATFPLGTFTVNVTGCLAIGFLSVMMEGATWDTRVRAAVLVGLLGGFTTFSTFSLETLILIESRAYSLAMLNMLGSVVTCILAVWVGRRIAEW